MVINPRYPSVLGAHPPIVESQELLGRDSELRWILSDSAPVFPQPNWTLQIKRREWHCFFAGLLVSPTHMVPSSNRSSNSTCTHSSSSSSWGGLGKFIADVVRKNPPGVNSQLVGYLRWLQFQVFDVLRGRTNWSLQMIQNTQKTDDSCEYFPTQWGWYMKAPACTT